MFQILRLIWPDLIVTAAFLGMMLLDIAHSNHAEPIFFLLSMLLLSVVYRQRAFPSQKLYFLSLILGLWGLFFLMFGNMLLHMQSDEARAVGYSLLAGMSSITAIGKMLAMPGTGGQRT